MAPATVRVEHDGPAAVVTIDRPKALNALDTEVLDGLLEAVQGLHQKADVHGIIVTGAGTKAFVAGADIGILTNMQPLEAQRHSERGHALLKALHEGPKVSIAAINGYALGGGLELALACDLRLASENAVLGLPEVGLGTIPGFGGTQRLPRILGEARAMELLVTGDKVDAARALDIGLVNKVVPQAQLLDEAKALVARIAKNGPLAVRIAKDVAQRGLELPLDQGLALEARAFATTFATHDQKEGMKAFLEKRKPVYEGR